MNGLLVANVVALVAVLAWLASLTLPSGQALRARNAFLLRRGSERDFVWTPESVPSGFRVERLGPPGPIAEAVVRSGAAAVDGDWPRASALVAMLVANWRREGHVRADLATTWLEIQRGEGSCADYVRVFLAAAAGAGLFCRQWAFSFDGFGAHGHTFVEVYDRSARRWVFLDVHNNVYAVAPGSEAPLDALSLRSAVLAGGEGVEFRPAGPGRLGWPEFDKLVAYYRRGAHQWYLCWGNDVIARDAGGRWAHRLASALGRLPTLVALVTPENEGAVARMERLRGNVRQAAVIAALLAVALCAQIGLRAWMATVPDPHAAARSAIAGDSTPVGRVPRWPRALFRHLPPAGRRARLAILMFHRVAERPDPLFPNEMRPGLFRARMHWVRERFDVRPLDEAVEATLCPRSSSVVPR